MLNGVGFSAGSVDGIFGSITKLAVQSFQSAAGIAVDRIAGPQTYRALLTYGKGSSGSIRSSGSQKVGNWVGQLLRNGDRGPMVRQLQAMLSSAGYSPGPVDGIFGNKTRKALLSFQSAHSLKLDGLAGTQTYKALLNKVISNIVSNLLNFGGSAKKNKANNGIVYKSYSEMTMSDLVNFMNDKSIPMEVKGPIALRASVEVVIISNISKIPSLLKSFQSWVKGTGNLFGKLNVKNIPNMSKQEILKKLPKGWTHTEHNGFVHVRDASGKVRMKFDPPDKVTKYDHVHLFDEKGNPLDIHLKIVDRKSPGAHIPYKK